MAAVPTSTGAVASIEGAKAVDNKRAQAKKAGVSLHDDRDLEGEIKDQALKVLKALLANTSLSRC